MAIAGALAASPSLAAVFGATGNLSYEQGDGLVLTGNLDADLEGLDLRERTRYVASARLVLPNGVGITPEIANTSGVGPTAFTPALTIGGPLTLFDESVVTPPFRVGRLLRLDLGPFTLGGVLRAGFVFLSNNPVGSETDGDVTVTWDVNGIDVMPQTLSGPFRFTLAGDPVDAAVDAVAADIGQQLVAIWLRGLPPSNAVRQACARDPVACRNTLAVSGVSAFDADYELELTLRPLGVIPLPGALPLLATAFGLVAIVRRRR